VGTFTVSTPDTFSYTFSQLTKVTTFTVTAGTFGGAYPVLTDVGTLDITTTGHDWPYDGGLTATFAVLQTAPDLRVKQAKLRRSSFPGTEPDMDVCLFWASANRCNSACRDCSHSADISHYANPRRHRRD